jgi:hypothetical protein
MNVRNMHYERFGLAAQRFRADYGRCLRAENYVGLKEFAEIAGIAYAELSGWYLEDNPVWIPAPDVLVGRWPGWTLPRVEQWTPSYAPFDRPDTRVYLDKTSMMRLDGARSYELLYLRILDRTTAPPVVWVDEHPGWVVFDAHRPDDTANCAPDGRCN